MNDLIEVRVTYPDGTIRYINVARAELSQVTIPETSPGEEAAAAAPQAPSPTVPESEPQQPVAPAAPAAPTAPAAEPNQAAAPQQ